MEDAIIILDSDEEDGERVTAARGSAVSGQAIAIDLTRNHFELDDGIIDLTATEDNLQLSSSSSSDELLDSSSSDEDPYYSFPSTSGNQSLCSSEWSEATSKRGLRTLESDISSPEDPCNAELQRDTFTSTTKKCLLAKNNSNNSENYIALETVDLGWPMPAVSASGGNGLHNDTFPASSPLCANSPSSSSTKEETETQDPPINKAFLYKLRYFKKHPISHFFHRSTQPEKELSPKPIPVSRMSILNNTKEENFHQSTLHFLTEFLTSQHYPPKDIVTHVLYSVLLGQEEGVKNEAYMVLMKVQKLHPATLDTVAWDWCLLKDVMDRKEYQSSLFLQYVVQTLDDDFQAHLQRRSFKKSLCNAVLSCDKCSGNVKNVIAWLMDAVENACDDVGGTLGTGSNCAQRVLFLLQRMLTIAVEVDNLPVTSSIRIADLLFPGVIVLKTREQREMFLSSTENHLLRAKILEIIFMNSCENQPPQELPLSLYKILYFIGNSSLLLDNQGPEWQRWDEILCHVFLLFFSLQRIFTDSHLQMTLNVEQGLATFARHAMWKQRIRTIKPQTWRADVEKTG
ncbi:SUMO-interacting motif-containing protein 1 isoform X2 [Hyperolius riggenbachi]|uniref:SUMO-interacting motif-containing protein 1 isoform X2 n=1 Tax=Hyperolius riggenbachi TaxID=752182 RepID=UPI0035A28891